MASASICRVAPSLAFVKYWGKVDRERNLPATGSLAVGIEGLYSETAVCLAERDSVRVGGFEAPPERYAAFFENVRRTLGVEDRYQATSSNNFPTSAGLASSSSGFAALAAACVRASSGGKAAAADDLALLSSLARVGSASAARAIWPGFVALPAGAEEARPVYPPEFWPELRIVIVRISDRPKEASSRDAMEVTRTTSPYYEAWVRDAVGVYEEAQAALAARDLSVLGPLVRASTYRMFGSMLAADPAIVYWQPDTLAVTALAASLRAEGVNVHETMDAGPQVKLFCLEKDVADIVSVLCQLLPHLRDSVFIASVGGGIAWLPQA